MVYIYIYGIEVHKNTRGDYKASSAKLQAVKSFHLVFNCGHVSLVKMALEKPRAIKLDTNSLADNFCRIYDVF